MSMAKQRRSFSVDQKLQIIQEAREQGVTAICESTICPIPFVTAGRTILMPGVSRV
jgi:hypothetical protein